MVKILAITLLALASLLVPTQAPGQEIPEMVVVHELPFIPVTAADIVSVLSEFELIQEDNPVFCRQFYGLTEFDTKTIAICAKVDMARKEETLLHEILHVLYWRKGIFTGGAYEPAIDARAQKLFIQFYGLHAEAQAQQ